MVPRRRGLRLGVGWRLFLGMTAVAAVLVAGELLATRTTSTALTAAHSMQREHEPLASAAGALLEQLVAFDRAVGEYVQAGSGADFHTVTSASDDLEAAVQHYFDRSPPPALSPGAAGLRAQLLSHIASARELASRSTRRVQWAGERQAALNRVYHRITTAGGAGLAINGTQVIAQRSLAELADAINAVRGREDSAAVTAQRERDFMAVLNAHRQEFESSPGRAWLELVRQDFHAAAQLRLQIEHYDEQSGPQWHSLFEDSAALIAGVQQELQQPADRGLLQAAGHAAAAAETAEHTLQNTGAAVLGVLLTVSVLLALSISLPVRAG